MGLADGEFCPDERGEPLLRLSEPVPVSGLGEPIPRRSRWVRPAAPPGEPYSPRCRLPVEPASEEAPQCGGALAMGRAPGGEGGRAGKGWKGKSGADDTHLSNLHVIFLLSTEGQGAKGLPPSSCTLLREYGRVLSK
eukprot:scaffold72376_cov30-Tisochrysis_lutea.AAC.3